MAVESLIEGYVDRLDEASATLKPFEQIHEQWISTIREELWQRIVKSTVVAGVARPSRRSSDIKVLKKQKDSAAAFFLVLDNPVVGAEWLEVAVEGEWRDQKPKPWSVVYGLRYIRKDMNNKYIEDSTLFHFGPRDNPELIISKAVKKIERVLKILRDLS